MNITEAKKENLPIDFITSFVSHGWEEIGNIKAQIEGINTSFKGTAKVETVLQELVDAYLICVGQLELYMNEKNYVDVPVLNEEVASKLILLEPEELKDVPEIINEVEDAVIVETPTVTITIEPVEAEELNSSNTTTDVTIQNSAEDLEPFEFFTSFDDVKVDTSEESPFKAWMHK